MLSGLHGYVNRGLAGEQSQTQSFMVTDSEAFPLRRNTKELVKQVGFHCVIDFEALGIKGRGCGAS